MSQKELFVTVSLTFPIFKAHFCAVIPRKNNNRKKKAYVYSVALPQLLLLHYTTTTSVQEIHANCPEQAVLECASDDLDTWSFLSVSWYKVREQKKIHRHVGVFVSNTCVFLNRFTVGQTRAL